MVGSWNTGEIDIADVNEFETGDGANRFSTFGHEVAEQQYKQSRDFAGYNTGHNIHGIGAEQKISGYTRGTENVSNSSKTGNGTISIPYTKVGSGTVNVNLHITNNGHLNSITRTR